MDKHMHQIAVEENSHTDGKNVLPQVELAAAKTLTNIQGYIYIRVQSGGPAVTLCKKQSTWKWKGCFSWHWNFTETTAFWK